MRDDGLRIRVERCDYGEYIGMLIGMTDRETGCLDKIAKIEFVDHDLGHFISSATLELSDPTAQRLMDDLWHIGIRPTEEGSAGQLAAVSHHLGDMRAIVADKLKVVLP